MLLVDKTRFIKMNAGLNRQHITKAITNKLTNAIFNRQDTGITRLLINLHYH